MNDNDLSGTDAILLQIAENQQSVIEKYDTIIQQNETIIEQNGQLLELSCFTLVVLICFVIGSVFHKVLSA